MFNNMAAGENVSDVSNSVITTPNTDKADIPKTVQKPVVKPTICLEILKIIKDAQLQHGLRHGDFQRYRSYCSRRLRRIRKSLHFSQGHRNKFQKRMVTAANVTEVRFLYVPLVTAERAWAYAMQLKQEANSEHRKKFHLISRLRKAAKHAAILEELCNNPLCDAQTKLEAQAYSAWMQGSLLFELKKWQEALEKYQIVQTIYEKLSGAFAEEEDRQIYKQRVDEISPNIRYCAYNIGDESAIKDLQAMRLDATESFTAYDIDDLIAQTQEKQTETLSEISWRGRSVPVKHEKVRLFLVNLADGELVLAKGSNLNQKVSIYERLLMDCKDAIQVLKDELKGDTVVQAGEKSLNNVHYLYNYLTYLRLSKTISRNLVMIDQMKPSLVFVGVSNDKLTGGSTAKNAASTAKKVTKPQDLVRLYEIIVQNLGEILLLPGIEDDNAFNQPIKAQISAYKACRCFYIAQSFCSENKWVEAIALYERVLTYIDSALQFEKSLENKLAKDLRTLRDKVEGEKLSIYAQSLIGTDSQDSFEKIGAKKKKPLVERLDDYCEDSSLLGKQPNLVKFPPDFKPVPCKPLFFDLALNHVQLPSLESEIDQKKGGNGLTGMVKGWLWGGKK